MMAGLQAALAKKQGGTKRKAMDSDADVKNEEDDQDGSSSSSSSSSSSDGKDGKDREGDAKMVSADDGGDVLDSLIAKTAVPPRKKKRTEGYAMLVPPICILDQLGFGVLQTSRC